MDKVNWGEKRTNDASCLPPRPVDVLLGVQGIRIAGDGTSVFRRYTAPNVEYLPRNLLRSARETTMLELSR